MTSAIVETRGLGERPDLCTIPVERGRGKHLHLRARRLAVDQWGPPHIDSDAQRRDAVAQR